MRPMRSWTRSPSWRHSRRSLRELGVTDVIVCGMGGSSLAPEVLAAVFPRSTTGMTVRVLDSTDPAAVRAAEDASDPMTTLRIIATKSGTTTETLAFLAHFWELQVQHTRRFHRSEAGDSFVAVTDPGASLDAIPHSEWFRESFLNPVDVGGRYSALTYVGLVPAALLGLDISALLFDAVGMLGQCRVDAAGNPGLVARRGHRRPGPRRSRQAHVRHRARAGAPRRLAGAAHRGVDRQVRDGHRARGRRAARRAGGLRHRPGVRAAGPTQPAPATRTRRWPRSSRPAIRSSTCR